MATDPQALVLEMLAARAGGGQLNPHELLLSQFGDGDPTTALLTRLLASREETTADEHNGDDADELPEPPTPPPAVARERRRAFERLRRTVATLYAELEALRARNDELAAAVGACYCWGDDIDCPDCGGTGKPGSAPPEQALFEQYIRPACRRMVPRRRLQQRPATPDQLGTQRDG
jgi:hypothetical protein